MPRVFFFSTQDTLYTPVRSPDKASANTNAPPSTASFWPLMPSKSTIWLSSSSSSSCSSSTASTGLCAMRLPTTCSSCFPKRMQGMGTQVNRSPNSGAPRSHVAERVTRTSTTPSLRRGRLQRAKGANHYPLPHTRGHLLPTTCIRITQHDFDIWARWPRIADWRVRVWLTHHERRARWSQEAPDVACAGHTAHAPLGSMLLAPPAGLSTHSRAAFPRSNPDKGSPITNIQVSVLTMRSEIVPVEEEEESV